MANSQAALLVKPLLTTHHWFKQSNPLYCGLCPAPGVRSKDTTGTMRWGGVMSSMMKWQIGLRAARKQFVVEVRPGGVQFDFTSKRNWDRNSVRASNAILQCANWDIQTETASTSTVFFQIKAETLQPNSIRVIVRIRFDQTHARRFLDYILRTGKYKEWTSATVLRVSPAPQKKADFSKCCSVRQRPFQNP